MGSFYLAAGYFGEYGIGTGVFTGGIICTEGRYEPTVEVAGTYEPVLTVTGTYEPIITVSGDTEQC